MFGRKEVGWETTEMAFGTDAAAQGELARKDDIGIERRLELFRLEVEIRGCEKRAFDVRRQIAHTAA
jgi:hypothetical protein